jgi:hypothetical protein
MRNCSVPHKITANGASRPGVGGGISSPQNGHLAETGCRCSSNVKVRPVVVAINRNLGSGRNINYRLSNTQEISGNQAHKRRGYLRSAGRIKQRLPAPRINVTRVARFVEDQAGIGGRLPLRVRGHPRELSHLRGAVWAGIREGDLQRARGPYQLCAGLDGFSLCPQLCEAR